jgi:pre-rRNA-processing protein TSR4
MPNLISNVKNDTSDISSDGTLTGEERRLALVRLLKGKEEGGRGMEWGTVLIFSCEKDCCQGKTGWCEEYVLVQWDT